PWRRSNSSRRARKTFQPPNRRSSSSCRPRGAWPTLAGFQRILAVGQPFQVEPHEREPLHVAAIATLFFPFLEQQPDRAIGKNRQAGIRCAVVVDELAYGPGLTF